MLPKLALQVSAFLVVFFDLKWIIHSLVRKKMSLDRGSPGAMQEAFVTLVNYRFKR